MTADSTRTRLDFRGFAGYCWAVLVLNMLVVLWGAVVRATGSGAGCGNDWPDCNGEIVPLSPGLETTIEFTHRLTSGLAMVAVLVLLIVAFRTFASGNPVRTGAVWSAVFILVEALVGAGLVIFELTGDNDTVARAVVIAVHLANTFLLLGALTMTAWWASGGAPTRLRGQGRMAWLLGLVLLLTMMLSMAGAVTALGDTLFPMDDLVEGIKMDLSPTAHFLIRLRVWHPALAIVAAIVAWWVAGQVARRRSDAMTLRLATTVRALFVVQLAVGTINLVLKAPTWMQVVHLLLADLAWVALVLLSASALAVQSAPEPEPEPQSES